MAWSMPNSAHWNSGMSGMAMTPDMNMGSYTPEQWAAMQQQNWQQWAQWQQQYAQWQSQYGEKYAEQMQTLQALAGMPPLPPSNSAPPPPPDKPPPPPPPPHENNQPLFGKTQSLPAPVPAPAPATNQQRNNNSTYTHVNTPTGNNQWSYGTDTTTETVNAEALKKLAEEERLFDIQFQKWEEEIEKWRRENVNHPDKQAYQEYEQKFEACRAQLMERRKQMNQKKAHLLTNMPPATSSALPGKSSAAVPPKMQNVNKNNYSQNNNKPSQNFQNKPAQDYPEHNKPQYQQQQYKAMPQNTYNKNVDPQDRYESYQNMSDYSSNDNYQSANPNNSSFLPTSGSSKGIPGLDLVPDTTHPSKKLDVIDITEERFENQPQQSQAPDYLTISKGIYNILGDEKIMNILSMVRGHNTPSLGPANNNQNEKPPNAPNYTNNSFSPNYQDRNQNNCNNQYFGNRQNMPSTRQGPGFAMNQNEDVNKYSPQNRMYNENQDQMPQEQFYDSNAPFAGANIRNAGPPGPPRTIQPLMGSNIRPPVRPPLQDMSEQHNVNDYGGIPQARRPMPENISPVINQPIRPKWVEEPMFTPSIIVEYEHKPLRLKARDFIEPVHMFDYNHISKDGDNTKKKDFEREADELFTRMPRRSEKVDDMVAFDRYNRDLYSRDIYSRDYSRDFERRVPRDFDQRSEYRSRVPPREEFGERRRMDDRYDDRRRDDRDKYSRHDDSLRDRERERDLHREGDSHRERDLHREGDSYRERDLHREGDSHRDRDVHRERDSHRERNRDYRREDSRNRSKSREKDSRKRGHSKESEVSDKSSKKAKDKGSAPVSDKVKHIVMIDDLLEPPGREMRPEKMIIILRGPPGSGKSYLAKLIRDREAEHGGTCRIMSIDDYFMQEGEIEEKDPATGKIIKKPSLKYEYDESSEETYLNSLKRAFKRSLTDGYFSFLIYDAVNDQLKSYADIWNFARQNGFQAYICTMDIDPQANFKRNIHNRKLEDIEVICSRFFPTPSHHIQLDATTLLQSAAITDVHMEDAEDEVIMVDAEDTEVESVFTSKWEKMDDAAQLARLDGISKPLRPSQLSMEDYLQLDDWRPNTAKPGQKTVRWADIEERRQQEKMRAIGFVVGQTDWNRMTDPTMGSSALTKTKYIERVRRNY